ncbi:uncharacterized metal-dependent hydrolase YcfH-like [Anneissia japonica]|uniref:uncharacterized metal-dependent hydrolase YcfH-like n=1 Tax=Anneissia japonica TaxID=1529436 RepID=UPI0014255415|nr:uncharacterized metal-dependent hydrolase YcfH-like [Anneissia japonica]
MCKRNRGFEVGVGIHPKKELSPAQLSRLVTLTSSSHVRVLGEIGLDHTLPNTDWVRQDELLERVLKQCYSFSRHCLICLHVRGMHGDEVAEECYFRALYLLRLTHIPRDQKLILHAFSSSSKVVDKFLHQYPGTYFSFTIEAGRFTMVQRAACKHLAGVNDRRILIESDGPYFPPSGQRVGAPHLLWETAKSVARVLGWEARRVLELTRKNGLDLF